MLGLILPLMKRTRPLQLTSLIRIYPRVMWEEGQESKQSQDSLSKDVGGNFSGVCDGHELHFF